MEIFTGDFKKHMAKRATETVIDVGVPRWMFIPALLLLIGQLLLFQAGQALFPVLLNKWGAYLGAIFPGVDYWLLTPYTLVALGFACFTLICFLTMVFLLVVATFSIMRTILVEKIARLDAPLYEWIQIPHSLFVRMVKDDIRDKEKFGVYLERLYNEHPPEKKEVAPDATAK